MRGEAPTEFAIDLRASFPISGYSAGLPPQVIGSAPLPPAPPALPQIRAVCMSANKNRIAVGTQGCEILEFSYTSRRSFEEVLSPLPTDIKSEQVVVGHFKDELWGLCVRPTTIEGAHHQYCTVSLLG